MLEEVELDEEGDGYQQGQHFGSDFPWDALAVMSTVASDTSALYASQPGYQKSDVGSIIDESAHLKKGRRSVGVARQYVGVIGKVDNCQVGVYASLVWHSRSTLINSRLYFPECWTEDEARCDKAGIPEDACKHRTKLQLALDMLKADMTNGIRFGWGGGDGLYGQNHDLSYAVDDLGGRFCLMCMVIRRCIWMNH